MDDEEICELIASLGPDISWANEATLPTADEIRRRVDSLTTEQRTALYASMFEVDEG